MSLETFPPLVLLGVRYMSFRRHHAVVCAGSRLAGFPAGANSRGLFQRPSGLGIGNGGLVFAEVIIPSGIAGLIVTMSPFWMVGAEALLPGGERLHAPTIAGMAVGLAGAALLVSPDVGTRTPSTAICMNGFLMLQIGMAGWSFGSIYQRRQSGKAHPMVSGGVQQLAAGLAVALRAPIRTNRSTGVRAGLWRCCIWFSSGRW